MNYPQNRWTRTLFVILILMGGVFSLVSPARAQGINVTFEDSIAAGQVVENDTILAGTNVNIDGTVVGDALAVGAFVEVNGDVAGSLVAIGQNVVINGTVEGTLYVAAVTLELGEEAELSRNLYYLGASLNTAEGSTIGRDLALISMGAQLSGDIGRNTVGIIGPWELFKLFMDLIGRPVFEPQTGLDTSYRIQSQPVSFAGFLPSLSSSVLIKSEAPSYSEANLIPASITQPDVSGLAGSSVDSEEVLDWLQWSVEEFFTLLVFGLIGIWLFSSFLKRSAQKLETKPLQSTGIGLLGLVISIALIGVVILVALMILVVGIGLASLSLWDLAWAVWGVGFTSLGLAFWLSLLFVSYGTKVIVAFLVGTIILRRLAPNTLQYKILPLLLGILIYVLLAWIPYFGWVIALLVNAIGLGAVWFAFRERGSEEPEEEVKAKEADSK
jgi:cytoskeletal protein CcmA (bactofilin family)